jgi:hypothetical protein
MGSKLLSVAAANRGIAMQPCVDGSFVMSLLP